MRLAPHFCRVGWENEGVACAKIRGRHILISDSFAGLTPKPLEPRNSRQDVRAVFLGKSRKALSWSLPQI